MVRTKQRDLTLIIAGALAIRLAYVLAQDRWALFAGGNTPSPDGRLYLELADNIAHGLGFVTLGPIGWKESGYPFAIGATAWVMPGYPAFLAAIERLFGSSQLSIQMVQGLIGALTCLVIARIAGLLGGSRAALISGVTAAVYYELVFATTTIATETLFTFLIAIGLWAMADATSSARSSTERFVLGGVLMGIATLVRPEAAGFACCIALAWVAIPGVLPQAARTRQAAAMIVASIAIVLPWSVRNAIATGRFTLSTESSYVMWLGNNPAYDRIAADFARFGGYSAAAEFPAMPSLHAYTESEATAAYRGAALAHIAEHPWSWLARAPHKIWNMWRPVEAGTSLRHRMVAYVVYPALIFGAAIGVVIAWRCSAAMPLLVFLAASFALHAAVIGETRYRLPLWTAIIPFFAVAVDRALG